MVELEDKAAASEKLDSGMPQLENVPEKSGTGSEPPPPTKASRSTRPKQIRGRYPPRKVTWYQISTSDLRSMGIAQAGTTVFAAMGTFALSIYIEFSKDIALLGPDKKEVAQVLQDTADLAFWTMIFCWTIAVFAFIWRGSDLRRIKN